MRKPVQNQRHVDMGDVLAMTFAVKVRSRHAPAPQLIAHSQSQTQTHLAGARAAVAPCASVH